MKVALPASLGTLCGAGKLTLDCSLGCVAVWLGSYRVIVFAWGIRIEAVGSSWFAWDVYLGIFVWERSSGNFKFKTCT